MQSIYIDNVIKSIIICSLMHETRWFSNKSYPITAVSVRSLCGRHGFFRGFANISWPYICAPLIIPFSVLKTQIFMFCVVVCVHTYLCYTVYMLCSSILAGKNYFILKIFEQRNSTVSGFGIPKLHRIVLQSTILEFWKCSVQF